MRKTAIVFTDHSAESLAGVCARRRIPVPGAQARPFLAVTPEEAAGAPLPVEGPARGPAAVPDIGADIIGRILAKADW